jgi:hypothetical protein
MHQLVFTCIVLALIAQSVLVSGQTGSSVEYQKGETWTDETGAKVTTLHLTLGENNWPNAEPFRMIVIGDSIAWGCGLDTKEKYHYLVADWLQNKLKRPVEVTVLAHTGATITKPAKIYPKKHKFIDPELGSWDPTLLEQADHIPNPADVDLILVSGGINDVEIGTILYPWDHTDVINFNCKVIGLSMYKLLIKLMEKCSNSQIIVTSYYPMVSKDTQKNALIVFLDELVLYDPDWIQHKPFALATICTTDGDIGLFADSTLNAFSENSAKFDSQSRNCLGDKIGGAVYDANTYSRTNFAKDRVYFASVDFPTYRSYGTDGSWLWELINIRNGGKTNDHKYDYRVSLCERYSCNWDDKIQAIGHPNVYGDQQYYSSIQKTLKKTRSDIEPNSNTNNQPSGFKQIIDWILSIFNIVESNTNYGSTSEEWSRTFGGADYDEADLVQQTSDGGYILLGWTNSFGAGYTQAWLIKTDGEGNEIWNKTFDAGGPNDARSIQQTNDGGYILAGTKFLGGLKSNALLVKTDSKGSEVWRRTFGKLGFINVANSVQLTNDGGYILAGQTFSTDTDYGDAWLIRTDSNGQEIWSRTFGGSFEDQAYSAQQTSDNGYILAGWTDSMGVEDSNAWLIKTDREGREIWKKTLGEDVGDVHRVQQTSDGGYTLIGGAGLIKTDSEGNEIWKRTFNKDGIEIVQPISNGSYILAGRTVSSDSKDINAWLIKTDSEGNDIWKMTFCGTGDDLIKSVQQTSDGGFILTRWNDSIEDAWLVKIAPF